MNNIFPGDMLHESFQVVMKELENFDLSHYSNFQKKIIFDSLFVDL